MRGRKEKKREDRSRTRSVNQPLNGSLRLQLALPYLSLVND